MTQKPLKPYAFLFPCRPFPMNLTDTHQDDGYDSAHGDIHSDTTSIASSMYAGYIENGRRYQIKREGEYWGPSDEKQVRYPSHLHTTLLSSIVTDR